MLKVQNSCIERRFCDLGCIVKQVNSANIKAPYETPHVFLNIWGLVDCKNTIVKMIDVEPKKDPYGNPTFNHRRFDLQFCLLKVAMGVKLQLSDH